MSEDDQPDFEELSALGKIVASPSSIPDAPNLELYEAVLEAMQRRIGERVQKSLVVVGAPGVGKSTLLLGLFRRLAQNGYTVLETSTGFLISGMKYIGEWQQRITDLITHARADRKVVVYFQDLNQVTSVGTTETSTDSFATYLRVPVERGELALVGETTPGALVAGLDTQPSFRRLFADVRMIEPTFEQAHAIVQSALADWERQNGRSLVISDVTLRFALELTDLYVPGVAYPGKTLAVLLPLIEELTKREPVKEVSISSQAVIGALSARTGLPVWLLDDQVALDLAEARRFFQERIIGQDEAVQAVLDLITLVKAGFTDPKKPLGVLMFVGPTGVGKTEIARALAEYLFGSADRLVRLDMTEFKEYSSYERLTGVYTGDPSSREGVLTRRVRQQPFAVVLLDEFEKAHPNVYDLMLQLFDDGRLTSGKGETVSFRQTIVVMTSNLGAGPADPTVGFLEQRAESRAQDVRRALERYYRPEFLNRIDRVVVFRSLDITDMQSIAQREVARALARSGIVRRELVVDVDDGVLALLLKEGFSPAYGARPLKRVIEQRLLLPIARRIVSGGKPELVMVGVRHGKISVKVVQSSAPTEVTRVRVEDRDLSPPLVREGLNVLEQKLSACTAAASNAGIEDERRVLLERSREHRFWADPSAARAAVERLRHLESLLEELHALENELADLKAWLPRAEAERRLDNMRRIAERYLDLGRRRELLALRLRAVRSEDQKSAFVIVRDVGAQSSGLVQRVLDMHQGWARRAGCDLTVVSMDHGGEGLPGQAVLLVSGVGAYGLFRGEAGLHRFASRTRRGGRRSELVRVRVLPEPHTPLATADVELSSRRAARSGENAIARAIHSQTLLVAEARTDLDEPLNRDIALRLLNALVASDSDSDLDTVVRVYYLDGQQEVRDVRTNLRSFRLDAVLAGDLLEVLGDGLS